MSDLGATGSLSARVNPRFAPHTGRQAARGTQSALEAGGESL